MQVSLNWTGTTAIHIFRQIDHLTTPRRESTLKWIRASKHYLVCTKKPSFNHCLSNTIYNCFTNNLWVFMASLGPVRTIAVAGTHVISQMKKNLAARAKTKAIQPTRQTFSMSPVWWLQKVMQDWGNSNVCISFKEYHATTALSDIILYQRNDELSIANWTVHYYSCSWGAGTVFWKIYCWNLWKTRIGLNLAAQSLALSVKQSLFCFDQYVGSVPSMKILHWGNACFGTLATAQPCGHTTNEAYQAVKVMRYILDAKFGILQVC